MSDQVHVVYSAEPGAGATWTYRSQPIACIGMAESLVDARADFTEALALALDEDEPFPEVIEHLERFHRDGFWVRIQLGEGARERDYAARTFIDAWTQLPRGHLAPPPLLQRTRTDIGEPIVIACLPSDSIQSVVDQLNPGESYAVSLSFADPDSGSESVWLSGIALGEDAARQPAISLDDSGLKLESTMDDLMHRSLKARPLLSTPWPNRGALQQGINLQEPTLVA